jgi:hypothetical protein
LYWPHFLEFVVTRVAEASQQIDRAVDSHLAQLDKALVRLDLSGNVLGTWTTVFEDNARMLLSFA